MASISNFVHLDCSWETSYSQPFVPTWSAMLHVPQGNAAGQCYHLFFFFYSKSDRLGNGNGLELLERREKHPFFPSKRNKEQTRYVLVGTKKSSSHASGNTKPG